MLRNVLFAVALIVALASSGLQAAPPDAMVELGKLTAGPTPILRVECGKNTSTTLAAAITAGQIQGRPIEGYPIDLGNGCGCPTLGWPWRYDGNTCKLQPGGQTCTGVCAWVRTLPDGNEVGYPTECGTL